MKKIALIKCSGSLNVGNEFINAGGKYLLRQIFPERKFLEYEFFDSAIPHNYKYNTPALLDWSKHEIEEECDLMVIFSGCIISKFTKAILEELSEIKIKKVLLGAGAYQYDNFDKNLCLSLIKKYDYIFTRDDITFSYFNDAAGVFSSIDLGFYAKDEIGSLLIPHFPTNTTKYALINIDLIKDNLRRINRMKKGLKEHFDKVYIIENTTSKYSNVEDFLYIGYCDNLYKTIQHASYVVTNRIHTVVCCLSNSVPFIYLGSDYNGNGRSSLFSKFGFTLMCNEDYTYNELKIVNEKIEIVKNNEFNKIRAILNDV